MERHGKLPCVCQGSKHQKLALAIKEIQTQDLEARMTNEKVKCRWILQDVGAALSTLPRVDSAP